MTLHDIIEVHIKVFFFNKTIIGFLISHGVHESSASLLKHAISVLTTIISLN